MSFPDYNDQSFENNTQKLINTCLTFRNLLQDKNDIVLVPLSVFDSFYMTKQLSPLSLRFVNYKPSLSYHTSAILASLIDSVTLAWRQKSQHTSMTEILDLLDVYKYKVGFNKTDLKIRSIISLLNFKYRLLVCKQFFLLNSTQTVIYLTIFKTLIYTKTLHGSLRYAVQ